MKRDNCWYLIKTSSAKFRLKQARECVRENDLEGMKIILKDLILILEDVVDGDEELDKKISS